MDQRCRLSWLVVDLSKQASGLWTGNGSAYGPSRLAICAERLALHHNLVMASQAPGADIDPARDVVFVDRRPVDVGRPPGPRSAFRMAHVIPILRGLVTYVASCHDLPLTAVDGLSRIESVSRYLLPRKRGT